MDSYKQKKNDINLLHIRPLQKNKNLIIFHKLIYIPVFSRYKYTLFILITRQKHLVICIKPSSSKMTDNYTYSNLSFICLIIFTTTVLIFTAVTCLLVTYCTCMCVLVTLSIMNAHGVDCTVHASHILTETHRTMQ